MPCASCLSAALLRPGNDVDWTGRRTRPPGPLCATPRAARRSTCACGRCAVFVCRFIDRLARRVGGAPRSIRVRSAYPQTRLALPSPVRATTGAGNSRPTRHGATDRPLTRRCLASQDVSRSDTRASLATASQGQTAFRVARRVDSRATSGGLSPRMMPPSSTTDTARTPPAAGHVTLAFDARDPTLPGHDPKRPCRLGVTRAHHVRRCLPAALFRPVYRATFGRTGGADGSHAPFYRIAPRRGLSDL